MAAGERLISEAGSETELLRKRHDFAVTKIFLMAGALALDGSLPDEQKFIVPQARQRLIGWADTNQEIIEHAKFEMATNWTSTISSLSNTPLSVETVEQLEACFEEAISSIAAD